MCTGDASNPVSGLISRIKNAEYFCDFFVAPFQACLNRGTAPSWRHAHGCIAYSTTVAQATPKNCQILLQIVIVLGCGYGKVGDLVGSKFLLYGDSFFRAVIATLCYLFFLYRLPSRVRIDSKIEWFI